MSPGENYRKKKIQSGHVHHKLKFHANNTSLIIYLVNTFHIPGFDPKTAERLDVGMAVNTRSGSLNTKKNEWMEAHLCSGTGRNVDLDKCKPNLTSQASAEKMNKAYL